LSNQQQSNKEELAKLERAISFTTGPIKDTTSYHTTIPSKHIIQAGMVKTTTISNGIKTTNTRMQTPEEQLASLRKVLEATGMLK